MARSRVELSGQIRRDWRAGGSSIRELADRHHVHRRTVRQALASAMPPPRKAYRPRPRPAIGPYAAIIDEWLLADRDVPRKQRHTARRVWQRLAAEHGATVAEVTVSRYVARRRGELGLDKMQVMVPQAHAPGAEAEVDFGEFHAVIAGVVLKLWMFVMRLSCSGRAFHVAFATQAREAFLEGHVLAFEYFGAVPARVRYDNLKPAVVRVLRGRDRAESERFIVLRSHYGYDSFFCTPGKEGAHEKGGVEGEIGRFRRRRLVPVPAVASLAALNKLIAAGDIVDDGRVITGRPVTIAAAFAGEQPAMGPLPAGPFDPARLLQAGRTAGPGCACGRTTTPSRPATPAGGCRCGCRPAAWRCSTGRGWWPGTSARPASTPRSSSWTITWKSCSASPARCPGRPRWPRPGRPGPSPPATRGTGTPPAASTATRPAPGC
jgi:transposase